MPTEGERGPGLAAIRGWAHVGGRHTGRGEQVTSLHPMTREVKKGSGASHHGVGKGETELKQVAWQLCLPLGHLGGSGSLVAPTRLKALLGLSGAKANLGLAPSAPARGRKQDGVFPSGRAQVLPRSPRHPSLPIGSQPGPAFTSGTGRHRSSHSPSVAKNNISLISLFKHFTEREGENKSV